MAKRERYKNLTDQQLLDGMSACYHSSQNHYKNAIFNSDNFGLGIALFIISIEELVKANGIFHCYIGLTEQETIDIAFNSKDKHRTRLKMALGLSSAYELIEKLDFTSSIEQKVQNADFQLKVNSISDLVDPEWHAALFNQVQPLVQSEIQKVTSSSKEIETEFEQHTSWFLHAQNMKERGLYADLINNQWESPLSLEQDDYQTAREHAEPIIHQVSKPIQKMVEAPELERSVLRPMMKQFIEMSKTDDNKR
ncbi:MAG: hypothetical protein ABJP45_00470 [Cyclobacteriaceae bacterium]